MRCYMCNGRGIRYDGFQNLYRTCEKCGGSGIAEPLTNEEYIRQASTEELAEWLQEHMDCASCGCNKDLCYQGYDCCKLAFVEWLKQPHTIKE